MERGSVLHFGEKEKNTCVVVYTPSDEAGFTLQLKRISLKEIYDIAEEQNGFEMTKYHFLVANRHC